jgi:benzoate/toluate 1,2-dioxygenase beta subunit
MPALDRRAVEDFLFLEARLLDEHRLDDWLALYAPDATYWCAAGGRPARSVRDLLDRLRRSHAARDARAPVPPSQGARPGAARPLDAPDRQHRDRARRGRHGAGAATLVLGEFRDERQRTWFGRVTHRLRAAAARPGGIEIVSKRIDLIIRAELDGISILF